jgi:hypothetical protein
MSILLLLTAVLMILARLRASGGRVPRRLVQFALALPPLAIIAAGLLSWSLDRTRVNVQFVGYRIPQTQVRPCSRPANALEPRGGGVWIGGGRRWPSDPALDWISLPGYRGRLVEICNGAQPGTIGLRAAAPGHQFGFSTTPVIVRTNDIDTQLVQLRDAADSTRRECVLVGGQTVPLSAFIDFAIDGQATDEKTKSGRGVRTRLLEALRPFASGNEVFCVDASTPSPQRCHADLSNTAAPMFLWREGSGLKRRWNVLPPKGVDWCACDGTNARGVTQDVELQAAELPSSGTWEEWKRTARSVRVRMLTRRSVGGVADQSVPLPLDRFDLAPLRLGTAYDFRLGRLAGKSLIVISEEPSVQLRMADLYGPAEAQLEDGVFDLLFGTPVGDEVLSIDLSSRADHLLPKEIFENVRARVSVPLDGDHFSIGVVGRPPEKHAFGEVFSLATGRPSNVSPLLVVQRVTPPLATFLLPLLASILLIVLCSLEKRGDPMVSVQWVLVPIVTALLVIRFALSTRLLLDDYASLEALHVWIENGAWLFLAPLLVMAAPVLLQRGGKAARVSRTAGLYEDDDTIRTPGVTRMQRAAAAWWKNLTSRDNAPVTEWAVVAVLCTLTWIAVSAGSIRSAADAAVKIFATAAIAVFAAALAWIVATLLEKRTAFETTATHDLFDTKPKKRWPVALQSLPLKAALAGLAYIFVRAAMTLPFGSQEQLPGNIRVDVLSLPLAAALLAAFTRPNETNKSQRRRFASILILYALCFAAVAAAFNDFGLLFLGAMALCLALPAACGDRFYTYLFSAAILVAGFVSPIFAPKLFREVMRFFWDRNQEVVAAAGNPIEFKDDLQVARSRDYYRLLDGNRPEDVEAIPSQLAREVVVERERVRYQSLDGAWRESFRTSSGTRSPWFGAGFLRGRPIIGDPTFRRAAQSDYVYPAYLRAEFGTLGILAALGLYVALFVVGAFPAIDRGRATLGLWASAIGVGTALFMLGGTARLFPFSGKWPLLLSFGSDSDAALAFALLMLVAVERD